MKQLFLFGLILIGLHSSVLGQLKVGKLEGIVKNESGQLVEGALVRVKEVDKSAVTDESGRFEFDLEPGRYTLFFIHVSLESRLLDVILKDSGSVEVEMKFKTINLSEIVVSATSDRENVDNTSTGVTRLGIEEIANLPTFLGEVDIIKSITLLPGVSTIGEGASGFNVRGGRIDQNLVLMDGVQLFNTSHVLGFFSIFNPELTRDFTLYKGNIPAQFGGRVSSVLDVKSIRGNREKFKARASVGTISSKLAVDGPLGENLTYAFGGRFTYSDWILRRINDLDIRNSSAGFNDLFGRLDYDIGNNHSIRLSYYSSYDQFDFSDDFGYEWTNNIVNLAWKYQISKNILSELSGSYMDYSSTLFDFDLDQSSELNNGIGKWQIRQNFNVELPKHNINFGAEIINNDSKTETQDPLGAESQITSISAEKDQGREYAIYVDDVFKLSDKISINAGLRYNIYNNIGPASVIQYDGERSNANIVDTLNFGQGDVIKTYTNLSPRISAKVGLGSNNSIKLSYNRLFQYIHLISNTTAPTPVDIWQVSNTYFEPIQADNYSIGYYHNFDENRWETSFELFYKDLDNVIEYRDFADLLVNPNIETELLIAHGEAYGGEVLFTRKTPKWTGWLSYTYARTFVTVEENEINKESINDGERFPANYDQPHSIRFTSDLKWGRRGSFGASFTYNTGRPITVIESDYLLDELLAPNFSDRNKFRIPDYWRLDVSFTMGSILRKFDDKLVLSIYNVFGRDNAYSVFFRRPGNINVPRPFKLAVLGAIFPSFTYSINLPRGN